MVSSSYALENKMTLLAVKETSDGFEGGTAELMLEITEGKGRVFLETSPLTKIDTQVSTRFAKQIACNYLEVDCNTLDFIYTIKSEAPIVGGPSAGASMTILTIATLKDIPINEETAITGTINSGGIIGPVGGVKEKVEAASNAGLRKVLIPIGETITIDNESRDVVEYGNELGVEVVTVGMLNNAIYEFTGKELKPLSEKEVTIDEEYSQIMSDVSKSLCERTEELLEILEGEEITDSIVMFNESKELFEQKDYYSAASKCFSANIRLNRVANAGINVDLLGSKLEVLEDEIKEYDEEVDSIEINTIPKLQTYMIVKERISESQDYIEKSKKDLEEERLEDGISNYAYAEERLESAKSWSNFFSKQGNELDLSEEKMKNSCEAKIMEASERIQYVSVVYGLEIEETKNKLSKAKDEMEEKEYASCLNTASLAKADVDTIIGSAGITDEEILKEIITLKLEVAKENIIKEQEQGRFPIAGYSYYEYSKNLMNGSVYASLLFSQYAQELSSFDIYFSENGRIDVAKEGKDIGDYEMIIIYAVGIITGVIITYMVLAKELR